MVNYTTAARDVETGLGKETVVLVEKKSSTGWIGKLFLAMLLVVVCCAGALLFAWYWNGRQEMQVRVRQLLNAASKKNQTWTCGSNQSLALSQAVPGETKELIERKRAGDYTAERENAAALKVFLECV